ncbi:MAG: DUF177 domain-containing protein [Deltaproteobacteria bacterium]|nr:DUF177 domain-containing protein [Deltaproteobacteria bacterium]
MEITIKNIPLEGREIQGTISLERLNDRFQEQDTPGARFTSAPNVELRIYGRVDGAELRGVISANFTQQCGSCLEDVGSVVKDSFKLLLKQVQDGATELDNAVDSGFMWFMGDSVNIEEYLQDILILNVPPFGFQHEGCAGPNSLLPEDTEPKKTLFGELLQKAVEKK